MADPVRPPRPILFTDLDGTLLDHHDYRPGPALAALHRLRDAGITVVAVTSKTVTELRSLAHALGRPPARGGSSCATAFDAWVVENGAAIHRLGGVAVGRELTAFGVPYGRVREGLASAAAAAEATVRGFGDMDDDEVVELTGLDLPSARAARWRDWSESFVLLDGLEAALDVQLRRRGLRMVRGGRFLTASGPHDKGTAVRALLAESAGVSYAVGDAPNDAPMLAAVDRSYQVRRHDGSWADLAVPGVTRLHGVGPYGFAELADRMLGEARHAVAAAGPRDEHLRSGATARERSVASPAPPHPPR